MVGVVVLLLGFCEWGVWEGTGARSEEGAQLVELDAPLRKREDER